MLCTQDHKVCSERVILVWKRIFFEHFLCRKFVYGQQTFLQIPLEKTICKKMSPLLCVISRVSIHTYYYRTHKNPFTHILQNIIWIINGQEVIIFQKKFSLYDHQFLRVIIRDSIHRGSFLPGCKIIILIGQLRSTI